MAFEYKTTQKISPKLKMFPHAKLDLHILQVPLPKLKDLVMSYIEENPVLEITSAEPMPDGDKGFDNYLDHESEGDGDTSFMSHSDEDNRNDYGETLVTLPETLQDHLLHQLHLCELSEEEIRIGELIIGHINDDGFFTSSIEQIAQSENFSYEQVEHLLHVIQTFEPFGVGARDLRECLLLQLNTQDKNVLAYIIINQFLPLLEKKQFTLLSQKLNVPVDQIKAALQEIADLEPKPGRAFSTERAIHVIPDATLKQSADGWDVSMNTDDYPQLTLSPKYRAMVKSNETPQEARVYLRERIQAARSLINAIKRREDTTRQIIEAIIQRQRAYLKDGLSEPQPMNLKQIAEAIGKDKSTVSRAIQHKYLQTSWGIVALKSLFHAGIKQEDQTEISSLLLKAQIREMIESEDRINFLSDQRIVELLQAKGLTISRRTVTKYRKQLRILSSHSRRE